MTEENEFATAVRDLLASKYDTVAIRNAISDSELGYSQDVWDALAEMGAQALPFAEEYGGLDSGVESVAAVLREVGRLLAPEPLLDAVLLPGFLVDRLGSEVQKERVLTMLASGELKLALAHEEYGSRWPDIRVETVSSDGSLTGVKFPVAAGPSAGKFLVSAKQPNGRLGLYLVDSAAPGVTVIGFPTNDERRGAEVRLEAAAGELLGMGDDVEASLVDAYVYAQILQAAETVGTLRESLEMTVAYLKQRVQFGKPLSANQVLRHRAADMYMHTELTANLVEAGVKSLAEGQFDTRLASQIKQQLGRAGTFVSEQSVQLHGGVGITFEYPISHYLSRVVATTRTFGTTEDHLRILASRVDSE